MITPFRLSVTPEQSISLIHQTPDPVSAPEEGVAGDDAAQDQTQTSKPADKPVDKPLLVMMHDFPGDHMAGNNDLYGEMAYHFGKMGYPSVRFDFRGSGESDCPAAEFSLESGVEDLNAVLDWAKHEKKYKSAVLMGQGVGAAVAVMGHRPRYVGGLVLLWPAVVMRDARFKELFTRENLLKSSERDAPFVEYRGFRLGSHFVHEIYNTDLAAALMRLRAPVLIQAGTDDPDLPLEQAYYARDHVGDLAEMGVFEGGGPGLKEPKMRKHLYVNIEHFLTRILKRLARASKT